MVRGFFVNRQQQMSNTILVGAQWGDEGKGKIIDFMTEQADIVVRAQGGANAGHTVIVGKNQAEILTSFKNIESQLHG